MRILSAHLHPQDKTKSYYVIECGDHNFNSPVTKPLATCPECNISWEIKSLIKKGEGYEIRY